MTYYFWLLFIIIVIIILVIYNKYQHEKFSNETEIAFSADFTDGNNDKTNGSKFMLDENYDVLANIIGEYKAKEVEIKALERQLSDINTKLSLYQQQTQI